MIDVILRLDFVYHLPDIPYELTVLGLEIIVVALSVWTMWKYGTKEIFKFQYKASYIGYFFLFLILILAWNIFVVTHFPQTRNQTALMESYNPYDQVMQLFFILSTVVIGPLLEEIVYRGVVMTALAFLKKYYIDVVVSALLFALSHVLWRGLLLTDFLTYLIPGLLFALYYRKTNDCIYYPILLHGFLNGLPFFI
ncbi:CPBP family intramembrane glutamic endopeptidase [Streptococcus ovis]|uniref:CPBP family intramembrane glutamic endopeptidase n=1 Tax=Streptococcus ovis TaxID=82806 RepID=UPI0012EAC5E9|nr:CPBP family intramembrane glutamic endopeptidase [Streptococcus ovis]